MALARSTPGRPIGQRDLPLSCGQESTRPSVAGTRVACAGLTAMSRSVRIRRGELRDLARIDLIEQRRGSEVTPELLALAATKLLR